MHKPEISLFHHPTTTVFVDDSEEFLYSVALGVDRLPYRSFTRASQGLAYVNQFSEAYDLGHIASVNSLSASVSKLFAQVEHKLNDHQRFAEPSVLVVDYSMPSMNGLDLCSQITNPNVKKVLLTGVADEKVAIDALNTELIDFYISKSESSLSQRLRSIISHLETRYFQDLFGWSRDTEVRKALPHLFDPGFADYFEDAIEELGIVEHYPLSNPHGFCLVNGYGAARHMIFYSGAQLAALLEVADLSQLNAAEREQLETCQVIPYGLHGQTVINPQQLARATLVEGNQRYYCAIMDAHHLGQPLPSSRTSFQQYLKTPPTFVQDVEVSKRN